MNTITIKNLSTYTDYAAIVRVSSSAVLCKYALGLIKIIIKDTLPRLLQMKRAS